jgi:DNA-binding NarL/FixJ family response regulator
MNNSKIKVVLVDDHQIFRTGLLASIHLFDDLEVLVDLPSGEAAIEWLRTAKQLPDVILMEVIRM